MSDGVLDTEFLITFQKYLLYCKQQGCRWEGQSVICLQSSILDIMGTKDQVALFYTINCYDAVIMYFL